MRVADKIELKGRELFEYLVKNKAEIIAIKKSMPIKSDVFVVNIDSEEYKTEFVIKSAGGEDLDIDSIKVLSVANMAMVCDSHMDVLAPDCWKKTIKERGVKGKNLIPHIHDHIHNITAKIGKVIDIRPEMLNLKKLGVKSDIKEGQALVFESEIRKDFNNKIYNLYKEGEVNQHSIGLRYIQLELAVNSDDEDFKKEKKVWNKHFDNVINKKTVEDRGYFWFVSEIMLFENSAVLFGSNEITPTLEVGKSEPSLGTPSSDTEPSLGTQKNKESKELSYINFI